MTNITETKERPLNGSIISDKTRSAMVPLKSNIERAWNIGQQGVPAEHRLDLPKEILAVGLRAEKDPKLFNAIVRAPMLVASEMFNFATLGLSLQDRDLAYIIVENDKQGGVKRVRLQASWKGLKDVARRLYGVKQIDAWEVWNSDIPYYGTSEAISKLNNEKEQPRKPIAGNPFDRPKDDFIAGAVAWAQISDGTYVTHFLTKEELIDILGAMVKLNLGGQGMKIKWVNIKEKAEQGDIRDMMELPITPFKESFPGDWFRKTCIRRLIQSHITHNEMRSKEVKGEDKHVEQVMLSHADDRATTEKDVMDDAQSLRSRVDRVFEIMQEKNEECDANALLLLCQRAAQRQGERLSPMQIEIIKSHCETLLAGQKAKPITIEHQESNPDIPEEEPGCSDDDTPPVNVYDGEK